MTDTCFCIHGHFYQPPRGNPFADDELAAEFGAEPYRNFNEKVNTECYAPNASLGNFDVMSFNLGTTLAQWLEKNAQATYERIVAADRGHAQKWGVGNALAQPAHHSVLPLQPARDKTLQVRWGLIAFEHCFGRPAEGMWLPEMAVDLETLQVLHDSGVQFTILSQSQVRGATEGAGPYWVRLPAGDRLAVYVRDDWHSNQLAYHVRTLGGAGRWARGTLAPLRKTYGRLILLALDGETFGHHHPGEEHFLHWLLIYEAGEAGCEVTTLVRDLRDHPPTKEIEISEFTAWNCPHDLARWSVGCDCTPGDTAWKGALRRAFDNLAHRVDEVCDDFARKLRVDAGPLLDKYFRAHLGEMSEGELLREAGVRRLDAAQADALHALLAAQLHRQRMYISSAFAFEDLSRPETRYAIASAARAIELVKRASEADLNSAFRRDLAQAVSSPSGVTGAQILDEILAQAGEKGKA